MRLLLTFLFTALAASCKVDTPSVPRGEPTPKVTVAPLPPEPQFPNPEPSGDPGQGYLGDPVFKPYVMKFVADARSVGKTVSTERQEIKFGPLIGWSNEVVGGGTKVGNSGFVEIRKSFWDQVSDAQRQMLIHHELGHSLLGRFHREDMVEGWPQSIMFPNVLTPAQFNHDPQGLLKELFSLWGVGVKALTFAEPEVRTWGDEPGDVSPL